MRKTSNAMLCSTGSPPLPWCVTNASCNGHRKNNMGNCHFHCNQAHLRPLEILPLIPQEQFTWTHHSWKQFCLSGNKTTTRVGFFCLSALAGFFLLDVFRHSRVSTIVTNFSHIMELCTQHFLLSSYSFCRAVTTWFESTLMALSSLNCFFGIFSAK